MKVENCTRKEKVQINIFWVILKDSEERKKLRRLSRCLEVNIYEAGISGDKYKKEKEIKGKVTVSELGKREVDKGG